MSNLGRENVPLDRNMAIAQLWQKAIDNRNEIERLKGDVERFNKVIKPPNEVKTNTVIRGSTAASITYTGLSPITIDGDNRIMLDLASVNHNSLGGLQGGSESQRNHLSDGQITQFSAPFIAPLYYNSGEGVPYIYLSYDGFDFGLEGDPDVESLYIKDSGIDHNALNNYSADRHFLQTSIDHVSTALTTGILKVTTGTGALSVVTDNSANWNTAYGWGSHATAGYALDSAVLKKDGSVALTADWDIGDNRMIQADKIRARDNAGLMLYEDGGTGIFIPDASSGSVGINNTTPRVTCSYTWSTGTHLTVKNTESYGAHLNAEGQGARCSLIDSAASVNSKWWSVLSLSGNLTFQLIKDDSSGFTGQPLVVSAGAVNVVGELRIGGSRKDANWDAAYTHKSNNGTDHSYINQAVLTTSTPQFAKLGIGAAVDATYDLYVANLASHDAGIRFGNDVSTGGYIVLASAALEFYTAATRRMYITGTGDVNCLYGLSVIGTAQIDRLGIGQAATANGNITSATSAASNYTSLDCYSTTDSDLSVLYFRKSSNAAIGTIAQTAAAEAFGQIEFEGVNSSGARASGGLISCAQDGDAGSTYIPAKIQFWTGTGASDVANRMTIWSTGYIETHSGLVVDAASASARSDLIISTSGATAYRGGLFITNDGSAVIAGTAGDHYALKQTATYCSSPSLLAYRMSWVKGSDTDTDIGSVLTFDKNGYLVLGVAAAGDSPLHIIKASAGTMDCIAGSLVTLEHDNSLYLSMLSPADKYVGLISGQPADNDNGKLLYFNGTTPADRHWGFTSDAIKIAAVGSTGLVVDTAGVSAASPTFPGVISAIQNGSDGQRPALYLKQSDTDFCMIQAIGTEGSGAGVNFSTTAIGGFTYQGMMQVKINTNVRWIPYYLAS